MKKLLALLAVLVLVLTGCAKSDEQLAEEGYVLNPAENGYVAQAELPVARDLALVSTDANGAEVACTEDNYSLACSSITSANLADYMYRDDVLYIDVRDYVDYAKGHLYGFESIPYFAFVFNRAATELDETVNQLYFGDLTNPTAVYAESDTMLKAMFPQDKTLFLMCQSGGRVSQLMTVLAAKGYDMSKVYNIGGMNQYADFDQMTTTSELIVDATYSVDGLTRN